MIASGSRQAAGAAPLSRPVDHLLVVVWFALLAGLGEAAILDFRHYVLGRLIWTSKHVIWMAPLSYLRFFLPVAMVFGAIAWRWPILNADGREQLFDYEADPFEMADDAATDVGRAQLTAFRSARLLIWPDSR